MEREEAREAVFAGLALSSVEYSHPRAGQDM